MTDNYEPPEIHDYHVELTEDHVRELRQTGEIVCEFDPIESMSGGADRVVVHVETDINSGFRVDGVVE